MKNCSMVVKELSAVFDNDSMDTFVSVYYDGKDKKFIGKRERICRSILHGKELENFVKTMEKIRKFIERNPSELVIFASHKNDYFKAFPLSVDVGRHIQNALVVDSSPYVRPLAEAVDEWEPFTLILMSSNHAKIYSISCGEITEKREMSTEIMNKHKKGGWSQARFQRLREGGIHAFFGEVAETLRNVVGGKIILAGPGHAKLEFQNSLPMVLRKKIIGVIDIDIEAERELLKESVSVINEREKKEKHQAIQYLRAEILKDGLGICGIMDTMTAVKNGQAELLLIERGYTLNGWICESCQVVEKGITNTCPYCGKHTSQVDVIEELIEFAERNETRVEFAEDEEIKKLGHVGALLRYK